MGNSNTDNSSSFICYNCNEKNFFDSKSYISSDESENQKGKRVKEVSIECKSCREINTVKISY
jgi:hypothetical protein